MTDTQGVAMRDGIDRDDDIDSSERTFAILFDERRELLEAQVEGWIDTAEHLIALFMDVAEAMHRVGARKVLVVDHTRGVVPDESGMLRMMRALEGQGFEDVRLAYVDARGTAVSRMEVGEILGRERGYECRVFDSVHRARIWLNYGGE